MIRINLLNKEEVKQEAKGLGEFMLGIFAIVAVIGVIAALHIIQNNKIESVKTENQRVEKRITELENIKKKVDDFKAKNDEIKRRIEVINVLEENRTGPLLVMDALADAIPERVWVDKFSEKGFAAKFNGVAWNEFMVAAFMKGLQNSPYFQDVSLGVIKKVTVRDLPLRNFTIEARLNYSGKVVKEEGYEQLDGNKDKQIKREARR